MTTNEDASEALARIAISAVGAEGYSPIEFMRWIFRHAGIKLPDDIVALWSHGERIIGSSLRDADIVFRTLGMGQKLPNGLSAGHLGIFVTSENTRAIVHVSPWDGHVAHIPINEFLSEHEGRFRGTRRYIASS